MAQGKDIKDRIDSVKKTKKITQAMKMVAAAKYKRAIDKSVKLSAYLENLENILNQLISVEGEDQHPLMADNTSEKGIDLIISADRGLCGGFNSYLIRHVNKKLAESNSNKKELKIFGNKAYQHFKNKQWSITEKHERFTDKLSDEKIKKVIDPLLKAFKNNEIKNVSIHFNGFISGVTYEPKTKVILPLKPEKKDEDNKIQPHYFYLTDRDSILEKVITEYINVLFNKTLIESQAAEESARMAAMESATDNASEMIKDLTLIYNRTRQAQITTELSEIVAGAEALNQ